jgi:hypothetical protein
MSESRENDLSEQSSIFEQIREFDVQQFLVATSSTLASLAFAKLEGKELAQAKTAIDAVTALLPLVEGELAGDLKAAVANLQVAYASAAAGA